jgi:general secretion pathway protein B
VNGTAPTGPLAQAAGPTTPGGFNGAGDTGERLSADDTAPAAEAPSAAPFGNHVSRATSSGVPLYQDAAVQPGAHIPELRLDLHVFAAQPQERFVMINMHKLHEGDSLPEGVRVESITPEGAVLSKDGLRFLLTRQ